MSKRRRSFASAVVAMMAMCVVAAAPAGAESTGEGSEETNAAVLSPLAFAPLAQPDPVLGLRRQGAPRLRDAGPQREHRVGDVDVDRDARPGEGRRDARHDRRRLAPGHASHRRRRRRDDVPTRGFRLPLLRRAARPVGGGADLGGAPLHDERGQQRGHDVGDRLRRRAGEGPRQGQGGRRGTAAEGLGLGGRQRVLRPDQRAPRRDVVDRRHRPRRRALRHRLRAARCQRLAGAGRRDQERELRVLRRRDLLRGAPARSWPSRTTSPPSSRAPCRRARRCRPREATTSSSTSATAGTPSTRTCSPAA